MGLAFNSLRWGGFAFSSHSRAWRFKSSSSLNTRPTRKLGYGTLKLGYGTLLTSWTKSRPSDVKAANVTFLNKPSPLSQQRPLGRLQASIRDEKLYVVAYAQNPSSLFAPAIMRHILKSRLISGAQS